MHPYLIAKRLSQIRAETEKYKQRNPELVRTVNVVIASIKQAEDLLETLHFIERNAPKARDEKSEPQT